MYNQASTSILKILSICLDAINHAGGSIAGRLSRLLYKDLAYGHQAFSCPLPRVEITQQGLQNVMIQDS